MLSHLDICLFHSIAQYINTRPTILIYYILSNKLWLNKSTPNINRSTTNLGCCYNSMTQWWTVVLLKPITNIFTSSFVKKWEVIYYKYWCGSWFFWLWLFLVVWFFVFLLPGWYLMIISRCLYLLINKTSILSSHQYSYEHYYYHIII